MKCARCFKEIGAEARCPLCGFELDAEQKRRFEKKALPVMHSLARKYELGEMLGAGGFGITYLACDVAGGKLYAVKEFFPAEHCDRAADGRVIPRRREETFEKSVRHFYDEAKTLYALGDCPSAAKVEGFFRSNNTAYIVMEYVRGETLKKHIVRCGGSIPYNQAKYVVLQIALALSEIHALGIVHSDISPSNIIIEPSGDVKLVDFGASKSFLSNDGERRTIQLKPGFAPPEQYTGSSLKLGPWTDIYALACTFYYAVTGRLPPPSQDRKPGTYVTPMALYVPEVEPHVEKAINRAMELDYQKRYKNADEFIADFTDYARQENVTDLHGVEDGAVNGGSRETVFAKLKKAVMTRRVANVGQETTSKEAYVEIVKGFNVGTRLKLESGRLYLIGRQPDICDLIVSKSNVISRIHCAVRFDADKGAVTICDKSSNGIMLGDGRRLGGASIAVDRSCMAALSEGEVVLSIIINDRGVKE